MDSITLIECLDIALVAGVLYVVIVWLQRARAGLAVAGALFLALFYLAARELRLELTAWIFQGFLAVFVLILVILLQSDLRRLFERVALLGVGAPRAVAAAPDGAETLCATVFELAGRQCGALIVLPGRDPVERYIEGGERLDGRLSRSLLLSLFDPGSLGHDGAVIVRGDKVSQFAAHLPLSDNFREIQTRGTRHSAAVGLSETTDALCIAVSEERGEVSTAFRGRLQLVESIDELRSMVLSHGPSDGRGPGWKGRWGLWGGTWPQAALAAVLSIGLWQLFIAGSKPTQKTLEVSVLVDNIDAGYTVESVEPAKVKVELTGLRRDLYLLDPSSVEVRLDASLVALGRRTFQLSTENVRSPANLTVRAIEPSSVRLTTAAATKANGEASPKR